MAGGKFHRVNTKPDLQSVIARQACHRRAPVIASTGPRTAARRNASVTLAYAVFALIVAAALCEPARAESLTYRQVLQRAVTADASLRVARMELARARLETTRVESQLDWAASGQLGVARDISVFGVPVDRADARASIDRRLESGSSLGFGVGVVHEDAKTTLFPFLPNPSQSVNVDANYRVPLGQGSGNASYRQGIVTAAAGVDVAQADWGAARNALAQQVADLFYAAAFTYARLGSAAEAVQRAERLKRFVLHNVRLGIAEDKDRLQTEAQLRARVTEQRVLRVAWDNQRIALNRLMERAPTSEWQPRVEEQSVDVAFDLPAIEAEVKTNDPDLQRGRARVRIADATIARRRDAARDKFDLVFSVGNRQLSGDIAGAGTSDSEPVAGARLEFRAALDNRGADAGLTQAFIDRDVARQAVETNLTNLRYSVARIAAEIEAIAAALDEARARENAERRKLDEATRRYRTGRATTAELIQFENDYEAAVLATEQQTLELAHRRQELARLRGVVWRDIEFPPLTAPEATR